MKRDTRVSAFLLVAALGLSTSLPTRAAQQAPPADEVTMAQANQYFATQDWDKAAEAYRAITRREPQNGTAWFRLGYCLHAAGRLDEAILAHKKAAEFPQARPTALYNLGCAYALKNDKDKAFDALRKALQAGFSNRDAFEDDPDLENLRDDPRFEKLLERGSDEPDVHRQFDFWVGQWNVFNPQGEKVGENRISKSENGFLILEEWKSAKGGSGRSMNYVDPADGKWKQVWVDASGGVVYCGGEFSDGAMRFAGRYIKPSGEQEMARATYRSLPDGKVRQFIEHSKDKGETWHVYFDGTYVPKSQEAEEATQQ
jgi:tetratricopeptide (TPR) repeat protein